MEEGPPTIEASPDRKGLPSSSGAAAEHVPGSSPLCPSLGLVASGQTRWKAGHWTAFG